MQPMKTMKQLIPAMLPLVGVLAVPACTAGGSMDRADINKDGGVSQPEFDAYMKDTIFNAFDADGDGKVTVQEWRKLNPTDPISEFNQADANGDGVITRAEADAAFDKDGALEALFETMDTGKDGQLSQAEINAFDAKMKTQKGTDWEKLKGAAQ